MNYSFKLATLGICVEDSLVCATFVRIFSSKLTIFLRQRDIHTVGLQIVTLFFIDFTLGKIENNQLQKHFIFQILDNLFPCALMTPLDCFWEGSKLLGPEYPVYIP